ncbi:amidohydrolase family protein [Dactylosporangium salmoneum]|uniref:Amidohydrolase family protein n=1 Tax=Dactylosporangium salmoneum TaxID=53361 RepID=A0ABP5TVR7_9ACTN
MAATAITGVRVFDGAGLRGPETVVIRDGLIAAGPAPDGAEVVDGAGGALLPGLIDTHVHVSSEEHLRACAAAGVSTVLDMAAPHFEATMALKGRPGLPSLLSAGRPASGPGSMFVTTMGFPASTAVTGPGDAERFVADRVADGSDYVKIIVEDPRIPKARPLAADTVAAVVAAAHAAGLRTVAHVVSAGTLHLAVAAGVDVVTHTALTSGLDAQTQRLLADRPVAIIPTLAMMDGVARNIGGKPAMRALSLVLPALRMRYRHAEATVASFRAAGRAVLAGTDANDDPRTPFQPRHGEALHDELRRLVRAGLTPAEALRGATSLAAATFGLADRGVIEPGRRADLVLVAGDPTRDIAATRAIRGVWIGGLRCSS